jgi:hypothetical protein
MMIVAALAAGGCAHIHAQVSPNTDVKQWKSAYLQPLAQDEFNMASFITNELHAMDVEVFLRPEPEQPQDGTTTTTAGIWASTSRASRYDSWSRPAKNCSPALTTDSTATFATATIASWMRSKSCEKRRLNPLVRQAGEKLVLLAVGLQLVDGVLDRAGSQIRIGVGINPQAPLLIVDQDNRCLIGGFHHHDPVIR